MLRVSNDLQHRIRSYSNFKELHRHRAVCKQWADITNIPKTIKTRREFPPQACLSRVTDVTIESGISRFLFSVLHQSQNSLKSLFINDPLKEVSKDFYIPNLPNL